MSRHESTTPAPGRGSGSEGTSRSWPNSLPALTLNLRLRMAFLSPWPSRATPMPIIAWSAGTTVSSVSRLRRISWPAATVEDLIQEGLVGLYKAIRDYRSDRESSFRNFAELCITRQIITAVKTATRNKHTPLNQYVSFSSTPRRCRGERLHAGRDAARLHRCMTRSTRSSARKSCGRSWPACPPRCPSSSLAFWPCTWTAALTRRWPGGSAVTARRWTTPSSASSARWVSTWPSAAWPPPIAGLSGAV